MRSKSYYRTFFLIVKGELFSEMKQVDCRSRCNCKGAVTCTNFVRIYATESIFAEVIQTIYFWMPTVIYLEKEKSIKPRKAPGFRNDKLLISYNFSIAVNYYCLGGNSDRKISEQPKNEQVTRRFH